MFKILSGTILCQQKWKQMPNYWVWAQIFCRALTNWRFAVLNSQFWCWDSYFLMEAIFFCIVGLPLFGKEGSGTPIFKILVRALFCKTNLSIVTILQDFSQLHVNFSPYTLISAKETPFSMKYNVYCLRKYMNTYILHTKFFDQNVTPYLHLALSDGLAYCWFLNILC